MAHNCHGKTKNLTAKTKYLTAKPKTSRQQILHSKNQIPHGKSKYPRQNQSYFAFAVKYLVLPWGFGFAVTVVSHHSTISNTKRIYNSFWGNLPTIAKQMPSKVLFVGKKTRRSQPFGHCAPELQSLATVNELKIIIFELNYLTVLVYTKTIIHSVSTEDTTSHLHFGQ